MTRTFGRLMVAGVCLLASPVIAAELPASVVKPYLLLQTSLAGDSLDGVPAAAGGLARAAQSLGAGAEAIVRGAEAIAQADDLTAARAAFGELSDAVLAYVSTTGAELGSLHVAYCPMADRSWLQEGGEIRNPYYGSSMLTCGVFKE